MRDFVAKLLRREEAAGIGGRFTPHAKGNSLPPVAGRPALSVAPGTSKMLKNPVSPRLLKKVQMQGGPCSAGYPPQVGPGVLPVRRSERTNGPTQQMGLFQRPAREG